MKALPLAALALLALPAAAGAWSQDAHPRLSERYDLEERDDREDLPGRLKEVSGLATTADGRVFAHADERAEIHEIDPATGRSRKRFALGERTVRGDFEGLAVVGDRFFLLTSDGLLYEFREADDRERAAYRVTDAGVRERCEAEGLAYDAAHDELLIACKTSVPDRGDAVVHRLPVAPGVERPAPVRIRAAELGPFGLRESLHPSGIEVDPATGHWVIVAAREEALLEVDRSGRILDAVGLSRRRHPQPEGVAFGPEGELLIADEGRGRDGRITTYTLRDPGGAP